MPIQDVKDATDVQSRVEQVFRADDTASRLHELRRLFVEILDFRNIEMRDIPLYPTSQHIRLPEIAHLVADLDGVTVAFVDLSGIDIPTNRVRLAEATDAVNQLEQVIGDVLTVFTSRDSDQLHFVWPKFVTARPTLRRIVVERDLPMRTAVQQLSNIYWNWLSTRDIYAALDAAFDVEAVTSKFFAEYRKVFNRTESMISCNDDSLTSEHRRLYVQTLFNRLMFVYFLSRKGWLQFNGETDYLNAIWRDYTQTRDGNSNFYVDRLEQLFFAGLNDPRTRNVVRDNPAVHALIGDVPFLNGGLFTRDATLDRGGAFSVPDEALLPVLTDLFDRFNFTVLESTPFDIEVAVDPEMLGKVFEETVNARNESGAFYTPRPVVAFMCREALKGYLKGQSLDIPEDTLSRLADAHDTTGIKINDARKIAVALEKVTVVDPACGSGAYILGMMQELVGLQTALYDVEVGHGKDLYTLKLNIIERNLFGADQDQFAVNIAMLRLWLSLAIEYEGEQPEPLPNLDYQILCGDSLGAPDPSPQNYGDLFRNEAHALAEKLSGLKSAHMQAFDLAKRTYVEEIHELERSLRNALNNGPVSSNAVDWRIKFPEVFDSNKGFDIVIANPPYVRQEDFGASIDKTALVKQYSEAVTGQSDLYCYFYVRGMQLLTEGGIHVFVSSNSWLDVKYGAKLKEYLGLHSNVDAIYDSLIERQFTTAMVNTVISVIRRANIPDSNTSTEFVMFTSEFAGSIKGSKDLSIRSVGQSQLHARDKWGSIYLRSPDIYQHVCDKSRRSLVRLREVAEVKFGLKTGKNSFFYMSGAEAKSWGIESEFLRPVCTSSRGIRRLTIHGSELETLAFSCSKDKEALDGTAALEYIQYGEESQFHEGESVRKRKRWYDLGDTSSFNIGTQYQVASTSRTYYSSGGILFDANFHTVSSDSVHPVPICVSLNSTWAQLAIAVIGRTNFGGGLLKFQTYELQQLLVADPRLLTDVDHDVLAGDAWDVTDLSPCRLALDAIVFDALGLTQDESDAVYEAVQRLASDRSTKSRNIT